ncbi:putative ribonuclease H-like domain-containing protein [Tanacetum coccineum]
MAGSEDDIPPPPPPPSQTPTQQTPHTVSTIKLPILKKGEYDIWAMKMEHYLAHTDYPIWEVIQRGNGPVSVSTDTNGLIKVLPPKTAEEILARERERKARTTLLMALPEDHLAKFHKMTDAKEMWEAIKSRFGGNDESKKMQKYILKQQFEGFSVSNSEGLHKGYDRFQSLLSQLEIHGAGVSTEDANQKFLRSLPSAWSQVSLIMRTKPGVDSLSFDDLYNNLRVFESDVKGSTASSSSTQNVAFVSENTSSTNDVSTAYGVSNSSGHNSQYEHPSSYSLLANQSSCPQLDHEDLEQLDEFDLEEMDLKWQVAMISMRMKKFYKKTDPRGIKIVGGEMLGTLGNKDKENGRGICSSGSDTEEKIRFMKIDLDDKTDVLTYHKKLLAEAEKEKEELKAKVEKWHNSSKNLNILLNSQMSARDKAGLGYGDQMNKVPPPMTGIYIPSGPDKEIDDSQFTYGLKQSKPSESDARSSDFNTCESNCSEETHESMPEPVVNEPKVVSQPKVWSDAPIIEEYESDSEDEHISASYIVSTGRRIIIVSTDKDIQDSEDVIDKEGQHQMPEDKHVLHDKLEKMVTQELTAKAMDDVSRQAFEEEKRKIASQKKATQATSTYTLSTDRSNTPYVSAASTPTGANAGESSFVYLGGKIPIDASTLPNADLPIDPNMPDLEDASDTLPNDGIFNGAYDDDEDVGALADFNNMDNTIAVSPIPTLRIHKDHPKGQILGDPTSAVQTRGKIQKASSAQQALVSYIHRQNRTNHKDHQNCLFACFLSQEEPKTISQALQDESWVEAMQEELLQFKLQKVWVLVDLPYGKKEEGIDYDEVFAPVARIEAIRLFLAFASYMGFTVYQMDVKSAFLYGTIEEEVYVHQPPGFVDPAHPNKVYKVIKALYGLHQAPRAWYETLSSFLMENGFRRGTIDKTLFIKKKKSDIMLVQVYVDDIIFGSTKKSICTDFEECMHKRFQMSSMGELTFFLGLQVKQQSDGIFISQDKYVADILKKFDFLSIRTTTTLIESYKPLVKDEDGVDVDVHVYRSMIGSLMYLTTSRPDIMFAVCSCARFQVTLKASHLNAVKKIFRYPKHQPKLGLWYPSDSPFKLEAYSDSDYGGSSLDRKSTTGGYQFLGRRLISWQCKKQTIVANSTTETEYVVAANCYGQVLWIHNQMMDYGFNFMNTKIHIDNESTISVIKNPVAHSRTKHIEIRFHFIRDCYEKRLIEVIKIHTDHNVADLLTKGFDVTRISMDWRMDRSCAVNSTHIWSKPNESDGFTEVVDFLKGDIILLLPAMLAGATMDQGEGSTQPAEPHPTTIDPLPSTSLPHQSPPHSPHQSPPHSPFQSPPCSPPHSLPPRSYEAPLPEGNTSGSAEASIQLKELMVLVPSLVTKVTSLEKELKDTKQTLGNTMLKLVTKVKSLEKYLKRKSKKVIVSASEGEEPEDQGRIIQDIDDDPLVSLVRESMKEKSTDFVTPTKASGEAQEEEISPTILEAAKTLSKVASQSVSKAKSTDKGKRYRRRARSMAKKINTGLDAEDEINTGSSKVDTGRTSISTSSIIHSPKKGQREGKAQMVEEDIQATHKTKEQIRQEEAGLEEAIRLQAQMDEEVAKQIHLDKMLAKRVQEEQELTEQQLKRKAKVQKTVQFYTEEDWDTIRAKLEANTEVVKSLQGESIRNDDFAKRMVEMINKKKQFYAEQKAKAKRKLKTEFEKMIKSIESFVPMETKARVKRHGLQLEQETSKKQKIDIEDAPITKGKYEVVKEEETEVPVKKTGMRRKQKARKGINIDKTAQDELNKEKEAYVKDKVKDASSESEIGVDVIPTTTKPPTIVN